MATVDEIRRAIDQQNAALERYKTARAQPDGSFVVGNRRVSGQELDRLAKQARDNVTRLNKSISGYTSKKNAFDRAQAELLRAQEIARNPITESATGISQRQANANVTAARRAFETARTALSAAASGSYTLPKLVGAGRMSAPTAGESARVREALEGLPVVAPQPGQPTTGTETPTTPPAGGGGGGGRGSGTGRGGRTREKDKPQVSWEEQLRKFFPQQAWMLDLDRVKYPKLFELLERAYKDGMWKSAEGLARFQAELSNTDFGIELRDKGVNTAIKTAVGDLGFGTPNYNKFIVNAANFGWEGDQLVREVYREAFRKNNDGTYANETARERALKSNDYLNISNIGTQFFTRIGEDTVQKVLTGDMARDDVERQQRELAKSKYGHLANLIDQGFTMQELANPYRQIASNLLERTADDVDMSQADFEAAYNFTDDKGNKRLMTEGEWERVIKSDAKYGWQNTNNANQTARQLAQSIAQSFGRLT
jgi:hypothetical protein